MLSHVPPVEAIHTILRFPPPKIFTNALLQPHDITALIRDTEAHERALFTVLPPEPGSHEARSRRSTVFNVGIGDDGAGPGGYRGPRANTAVGRVLGKDLLQQIRKNDGGERKDQGEVDIEALLKGAERLCQV